MHLSFGQILRAILTQAKISNTQQHLDLLESYIESALASSLYAINCAINSTTNVSPVALVFQRDMLLPISCFTNWEIIHPKKQQRAQHNNFLENLRRRPFTYTFNMEVMLQDPIGENLSAKCKGPFKITKVHPNGTVTICLKNNVFQRVNIRHIKPYFRK